MRILIAGEPQSGQREVLELLTKNSFNDRKSFEGVVLDHTFSTKYFDASCGIWVDEFDNASKWVSDFTSDEAAEIRDALTLFIYTYSQPDPPLADLAVFARSLDSPGKCIAVGKNGINGADHEDIDVIEMKDLEQVVHTALFDALDTATSDDSETPSESVPISESYTPIETDTATQSIAANMDRDLDDIVAQLKNARDSTTMSEAEKIALVDRIVKELDP